VEWTAAEAHGNRELQGVSEALVRSFSKRTGQIDAELDRLAAHGRERTPRLVKWAVRATRRPKQHETPDTLYDRWRAEAAERGVDPDTFVRTVTGRTADRDQDWTVSAAVAVEALADGGGGGGREGVQVDVDPMQDIEVVVDLVQGLGLGAPSVKFKAPKRVCTRSGVESDASMSRLMLICCSSDPADGPRAAPWPATCSALTVPRLGELSSSRWVKLHVQAAARLLPGRGCRRIVATIPSPSRSCGTQ
jgi:hypothetical protein